MRGRKLLALLLCAALCAGCVLPTLAAGESADQALMEVTAKVKATLDLDTEMFTDFRGWANEDVLLGKRWSLEWSGDGVWLSITAGETGKIYSYNLSQSAPDEPVYNATSWYMGGKMNIPRLPQDKSQAAFDAAQDFLGKVLEAPVETIELKNNAMPSLRQSNYRFSGNLLLNGLASPVSCSVTVRASDLTITRFWRGDEGSGYLPPLPGAGTIYTEAQARRQLTSTLNMEARYVLEPDGKTAKVRYVPLSGDEFYVDGQTGQLVNLTELRQKLWRSGGAYNKFTYGTAAAEAPEAANGAADLGASLTQAEKEGAAVLEGALSKEELDRAVQNAWPEIGLDTYTLASASYSVFEKPLEDGAARTKDDYNVTCRLTYGRQEGDVLRNKYVTMDAKTGQLQSLYARRYYRGEGKDDYARPVRAETAQSKAGTFLKSYAGSRFDQVALFRTTDASEAKSWQYTYTYQQTAGGWFYSGNFYTVGVDAIDGTICQLDFNFNDEVVLQVPEKVVSVDEAIQAYAAAMDVPYGYLEVPVSISLAGRELMPLLKEAGYEYVTALKTGWTMTQPENKYIQGVDAETGKVITDTFDPVEEPPLAYDDVEGHWVQTAAQALAVFGIGLRGGSLKPGEALTQLDMICLLSSVDGYVYDPTTATDEETDWLYRHAYALGLVTPETRAPGKTVSRGELVKLILDAAGYERIAGLKGVFRTDFSDNAAIPESQAGYAALAQGFGLVKGGSDGAYAATRAATRAEAVSMLYQYMK